MSRQPANTTAKPALRALRLAANLSQAEVADRINEMAARRGGSRGGVDANMVSRWERGLVTPGPLYRRLLAELHSVTVDDLALALPHDHIEGPTAEDLLMADTEIVEDPRVLRSQDGWRATRRVLNANRLMLSQVAAGLYPDSVGLANTGLIASPEWIPAIPVEIDTIQLTRLAATPPPALDGTEPESLNVRPCATLTRPYARYSQAIRDLDHPRLFENRPAWRLLDVDWGNRSMAFGDTWFFAAVDVNEVLAHEVAYVHLGDEPSQPTRATPMRDLPYRRLVDNPFDLTRRPVMPAISTLTIRGGSSPSFILHRRDPKSVAMAGGMLQVIPSGIFQASSLHPAAVREDFSLWRNIQREYAEELLGFAEHDGDGQPISYATEPFASMDRERAAGRIRIWCLGVALDALTLVGEIMTVAVVAPDLFDRIAADFVDVNDEGTVVNGRFAFTEQAVGRVLRSGRMAPAGAGCLTLALRHRGMLLA